MAPSRAPTLYDAKVACAGLEGDGVGDKLFELLWKRDLFSDSALALRIPDTVVFRYSAPAVWYFTSVDGTIKRKTKAKVSSETIFEEFLKRQSPSGILACYVYSTHAGHSPEPGSASNEKESNAATRTTVEYLTRDDLWHLLFNRQKVRPDGILQKFVEPKEDRNNMIRVLWSPKVCLLERRVNNKRLSDTKLDVYERAVTFEGSDFLSQVTPVRGPAMVMQVHDVADAIVQHIAAVTGDKAKISRMALNFKIDDKDRLWLLFPSSLRLRDELKAARRLGQASDSNTPLEANAVLQVPEHVRRIGTITASRPAALQCTSRCPTCEDKVEAGGLCDVSYKVIIEYEEMRKGATQPLPVPLWPPLPSSEEATGSRQVAESGVRDDLPEVPEPLRLLHPRLSPAEYSHFRHDVSFLYKSASVCEACYLRFSAPQLGSQWRETVARLGEDSAEAVEIKGLDPERLRRRQQATQRRVLEQKAAEDGQAEELMRCGLEAQKLKGRAQSCPKLPSYGQGYLVRPPDAVLESRPQPPRGGAPLWIDMRPGRSSPHLLLEMSPQRRRRVPPLLGEPYLKDLQAFAIKCPSRAHHVVPTMPPNSWQPNTANAKKEAPKARATQPAKPQLRPGSADDMELAKGMELEGGAPSQAMPLSLDDSDNYVLDATEVGDVNDPLVAELWEKWPEGHGSAGGSASTTRPPSAADGGTRPSSGFRSYPTSGRNSSRAVSRLWSAQSTARPRSHTSRPQSALQRSSSAGTRPLSSPLTRGDRGLGEHPRLARPSSSPNVRPSSSRPPPAPDSAAPEA